MTSKAISAGNTSCLFLEAESNINVTTSSLATASSGANKDGVKEEEEQHQIEKRGKPKPSNSNSSNKARAGGVRFKYKECMKNHAAAIGGNARDGCCEFMPNGEEGTLESLVCSACNCHRNFHKKLQLLDNIVFPSSLHNNLLMRSNAMVAPQQQRQPPNRHSSWALSEDEENGGRKDKHKKRVRAVQQGGSNSSKKKRFRTKFTEEQKEKLVRFAEEAGWQMQKLQDSVVQGFCQEIGIRRKVLKVWMHNNKHTFSNKQQHLSSNHLSS